MNRFQLPMIFHQSVSQKVEKLGVGGSPPHVAEVIGGIYDSDAKMIMPQPIGQHPRGQGIGRMSNPLSQVNPTLGFPGIGREPISGNHLAKGGKAGRRHFGTSSLRTPAKKNEKGSCCILFASTSHPGNRQCRLGFYLLVNGSEVLLQLPFHSSLFLSHSQFHQPVLEMSRRIGRVRPGRVERLSLDRSAVPAMCHFFPGFTIKGGFDAVFGDEGEFE